MLNPLPQGLVLRRPTLEDAQAVLELITACDIAEYGEPDSDLEDLLGGWSEMDLEQDAWLVHSGAGQMVGYAGVSAGAAFAIDLYVLPRPDRFEVNLHLLQKCLARARQLRAGGPEAPKDAVTYPAHLNRIGQRAAEAAGFALSTHHFRMQIDLSAALPAPVFPPGVTLRSVVPGQDDRAVYDFIQAAFERPGRVPPTFEQWRSFMMRADHFHPELWFLACRQDELVGAILCYDYPQYGWVRQLGVAAAWRRQGLGAALLRHVFALFQQRGQARVALGVDSKNSNAYQFYENLGMQRVRQFDEYRISLEGAAEGGR